MSLDRSEVKMRKGAECSAVIDEVSTERGRWDCPDYLCLVFTSEEKWETIIDYVEAWDSCTYDTQKQKVQLSGGGVIKFYNLKNRTTDTLKIAVSGLEVTTSILDIGVVHRYNCQLRDFPLYLMSRMRSVSKYSSRLVII